MAPARPELLLEQAIDLAARRHAGSVDRAGQPYITHPLRVLSSVAPDTAAMTVAIMHDLVEDTDTTLDELRALGYPDEIVTAVDHVTRREGEDYLAYVRRAVADPLAAKVKEADLRDNMDLTRLPQLTPQDWERMQRYHAAWQIVRAARTATREP